MKNKILLNSSLSLLAIVGLFISQNTSAFSRFEVLEKSSLSGDGIIHWTNVERKSASQLGNLLENEQLNEIARQRMDDMFNKQYFAHVSPSGQAAEDLSKNVGYSYLMLGENIALGDFNSDKAMVRAWMESPGHRANILNNRYSHIGVAVGRGLYKGKRVWIGVQIFGLPRSACSAVDDSLRKKAEAGKKAVSRHKRALTAQRNELEKMPKTTQAQVDRYNAKLTEYNALVRKINSLVRQVKTLTSTYNRQVAKLNACVKG